MNPIQFRAQVLTVLATEQYPEDWEVSVRTTKHGLRIRFIAECGDKIAQIDKWMDSEPYTAGTWQFVSYVIRGAIAELAAASGHLLGDSP